MKFNNDLASEVSEFWRKMQKSSELKTEFSKNPTAAIKKLIKEKGITVEQPELFHAHAIKVGDSLPSEPERATRERYIYIFRQSGLFEFKIVPASPSGDDSIMLNPRGACQCCNCCVLEV